MKYSQYVNSIPLTLCLSLIFTLFRSASEWNLLGFHRYIRSESTKLRCKVFSLFQYNVSSKSFYSLIVCFGIFQIVLLQWIYFHWIPFAAFWKPMAKVWVWYLNIKQFVQNKTNFRFMWFEQTFCIVLHILPQMIHELTIFKWMYST